MGFGRRFPGGSRRRRSDRPQDADQHQRLPEFVRAARISDIGFYGNARKIDGPDGVKKEVPYYQMLLGGTAEEFGMAIQSLPARLAPTAVLRVLAHFKANREEGESFRGYVMRHKVEPFRSMTADLVKPADLAPEMYRDWGDDIDYSLKLGRGECAA